MIPPDDDRRFDLSAPHIVVDRQAESGPLAIAQPADARRQSLKLNSFARDAQPTFEPGIVGEQFQRQSIRDVDVGG